MNEKLRKEKAGLEQEYMRLKHANNTDNLTEIQVRFLLKNCRLSTCMSSCRNYVLSSLSDVLFHLSVSCLRASGSAG